MLDHYYRKINIYTGAFAFIEEQDVCRNGHIYHEEIWEDGDSGARETRSTVIGQCPPPRTRRTATRIEA